MMLRPYKINEKVQLITHDFDLDFNKTQIKNSQVLASVTSDWNRYKKKLNELSEEE